MSRIRTLVSIACMLVAAVAFAQDAVQLQLNLEPGKTYRHKTESKQVITQSLMGMEQENLQNIQFAYSFAVESVDDKGVATATLTYDRVAATMSAGPIKAEYDSDKPEESTLPPMMEGYKQLAGSSYKVTIGPDGLIDTIEKVDGQVPDDEAAEQVRSLFEQTFAIYPETLVELGDSWSREVVPASVLPMSISNTWTLKELNDASAIVALESAIKPDAEAEGFEMQGMRFNFDFTGQQSGDIVLDRPSGWIQNAELSQSLEGVMKLAAGADSPVPGGLEVPVKMTSTLTVTTPE